MFCGSTILIARGDLELETDIESESAPLNSLVQEIIAEASSRSLVDGLHCLRRSNARRSRHHAERDRDELRNLHRDE